MFQSKWQASILSFATQRGNWSLGIVSCPKAKIQTAKNFKGDPGVPVPKLPPPSWQNSTFFTETEGFFFHFKEAEALGRKRRKQSHPPGLCGFQLSPVTYLILIFPVPEAQFCSLRLSTNTKDAGIPSWTAAWQDSNLSYLKRMHPLLFKKKRK